MRRTKILATVGPASSSEEMIERLLTSGVDAFRLNFSHGKHEEHAKVVATIRDVATELGRYVPIVGDIQGPKLRIGEVDGLQHLETGQPFVITTEPRVGNAKIVSTPFTPLPREV
ncbi:MAG TPA: pyruvate kinase, partial [Thermoanaerobaculia bacterium]|nr:pyruvate kinase [Thermoanaerobaculia bacterium]